ncbi:MAG: DUF3791 domain-containing protein [Bacteroides sp.]|nr:DUF3791 domain-containing protein [Bacteroides sp.]
MDYRVKDKAEYIVIFVQEFSRRHSLTMRQAYNYLHRFKGIDFLDRHYSIVHTQSFRDVVEDITDYCHRQGGLLV